jgi:hypothetical protein
MWHNTDMNTSLSILARALATENLTFAFDPAAETASFDVKHRHLIMPVWDVSDALQTMLVAHEISHALWTPNEESERLLDEAEQQGYNRKFLHRIANMIEDVRIEKKMKDKYPGTRRDFFLGYKEIVDRDTFGFSKMDFDSMGLINRLNVHFKWGVPGFIGINLSSMEQGIADLVDGVETFAEVITLAKELYNHDAIQQEKQDFLEQEQEGQEADDGNKSREGQPSDKQDENNGQRRERDLTNLSSGMNRKQGDRYDYPSITLSPVANVQDQIGTTDSLLEQYEKYSELPINLDEYRKYVKESDAFVRQLVAQFERRKAADEIRRERPKQTGMLNLDRLHQYRTHDDIFLSKIIKQDGKNHGIVFMLDLSGSMGGIINECFHQVAQLVWFCERAKIPFEVFGFTDGNLPGYEELHRKELSEWVKNNNTYAGFVFSKAAKYKHQKMHQPNFGDAKLYCLASSRDSAGKRERLLAYLWETYVRKTRPSIIRFGNTPTVECMILVTQFMQEWVTENNVQIPTLMLVTDGDPNCIYMDDASYGYFVNDRIVLTVNNEMTGTIHRVDGRDQPNSLPNSIIGTMLDSLRTTMNVRCVGMFVGPKTFSDQTYRSFCLSQHDYRTLQQDRNNPDYDYSGSLSESPRFLAAKEAYNAGALLANPALYPGYDAFFVIRSPRIVNDDEAIASAGNFTKVKNTFVKTMAQRSGCRVFLTKYVDIVAGQPLRTKDTIYNLPVRKLKK